MLYISKDAPFLEMYRCDLKKIRKKDTALL